MARPQVNICRALYALISKTELSNADIAELFDGRIGGTSLQRLKKEARAKTLELGRPVFNPNWVNTECLLLVLGYEQADLERRYQKLKRLGMLPETGKEGA